VTDAALLSRARAYPFGVPRGSFSVRGGRREPPLALEPGDRIALLTFGANASPAALARKLAGTDAERDALPVVACALEGFDVVHSAHVSPYGSIPAALQASPGTVVHLHLIFPTPAQFELIHATEGNYELAELPAAGLRLDPVAAARPAGVRAYATRHGCLQLGGRQLALEAIAAERRTFETIAQPDVLAHVRDELEPGADLDEFILRPIRDPAVAAARTAQLRARAAPLGWR
jgi:hypothetical protein